MCKTLLHVQLHDHTKWNRPRFTEAENLCQASNQEVPNN